jgi:hypothetical protein
MSEPTKPNYQQMEQYQQLRFTRITTSVVTEPVNQRNNQHCQKVTTIIVELTISVVTSKQEIPEKVRQKSSLPEPKITWKPMCSMLV